jgi:DNA polymerase-1
LQRLFLIDGPSLVYRAFFALPESIATSAGVHTNAIFGFASMLVKIITEHGLQPTVVAWDAGSSGRAEIYPEYKALRRERPDLLREQWPAMERLVDALGYENVTLPGYEADDVLASLAERARAAEPPIPATIVTGDRDVLQLVDEQGLVQVMATTRGITDTKIYDRQAVIDRYGVPPELIPDFYGLKGDTSDNIPGVPGIGEKTAAELISRFGSLEGVLEHVDEIGGAKRKQNLIEHAPDARLSKELATIRRDLPIELDLAALSAHAPDEARVREVFREFELRAPLRRLEEALSESAAGGDRRAPSGAVASQAAASGASTVDASSASSAGATRAAATLVPTSPGRRRGGSPAPGPGPGAGQGAGQGVLSASRSAPRTVAAEVIESALADVAALPDTELCVAVRPPEVPEGALFAEEAPWRFAVAAGTAGACVPGSSSGMHRARTRARAVHPRTEHHKQASASVADAAAARTVSVLVGDCDGPAALVRACGERPVVAHDAKALDEVPRTLAHDTLLAAYLLAPARRGYPLAELAEEHELADLVPGVEDPVAREALVIQALAARQRALLPELGLEGVMRDIELPLVPVLRAMERAGVRLNVALLRKITDRVRKQMRALERDIFELAGEEFLISSPQQLAAILFEKLGLSRKRRGKTGFSTDARVLQAIRSEHEIVPRIERWRELQTLVKTYLDVLPSLVDERSRLHTTFLQAVAQTGRLSSTNPNLQNVPVRTALGREIRECFEAQEGMVLIAADYSQIELRVLAHVAQEPALMEIFKRGEDVHAATAAQVFCVGLDAVDTAMRSKSKMINYGIVYGLSGFGLADRLNIPREEADAFIAAYLERFPNVARFMRETVDHAIAEGHVRTLWGRWRPLPELESGNYQVRSAGERLAVNTVIQGSAADIIKLAMVRCHAALADAQLRTRLLLTIHDELLFEGPPGELAQAQELIEREMVGVWTHEPPLAVDIGTGRNWLQCK